MKTYKIADLIIEMSPKYEPLITQIKDYEYKGKKKADIIVPDLDKFVKETIKEDRSLELGLTEYMLYASYLYTKMIEFNVFYLHASTVVYENEAYLFSAPSGVGKSTHTKLWLSNFKDSYILNDDKPLLKMIDNVLYAYGSPISGKDGISQNKRIKVKAICFINRDKENWIKKLSVKESISKLYSSTVHLKQSKNDEKVFMMIENILTKINIFEMGATISNEAALLSYQTMKGIKK